MTMRVFAFIAILGSLALAGIQGELLNSNRPWFVIDDTDAIYMCEWYNYDTVGFNRADTVYLSTGDGTMGALTDSTGGDVRQAQVWITTPDLVGGVLLNDYSPWVVHINDTLEYRAELLEGRPYDFHQDDTVILTTSLDTDCLIPISGNGKVAKVAARQIQSSAYSERKTTRAPHEFPAAGPRFAVTDS